MSSNQFTLLLVTYLSCKLLQLHCGQCINLQNKSVMSSHVIWLLDMIHNADSVYTAIVGREHSIQFQEGKGKGVLGFLTHRKEKRKITLDTQRYKNWKSGKYMIFYVLHLLLQPILPFIMFTWVLFVLSFTLPSVIGDVFCAATTFNKYCM